MQNMQQSSLPNVSQLKKLKNSFWNFSSNLKEVFQMVITNCQLLGAMHTQTNLFGVWS